MVIQEIDNLTFETNEVCNFSFLADYGKVFCVFAENDSGNICFGTDNGYIKHFIKIAGAKTINSRIEPKDTVENLKKAIPLYKALKHANLIEFIDAYAIDDLYISVFKWVDGECLFDHWNFKKYAKTPQIKSPKIRFKELPIEKRINSFNVLFSFLMHTVSKGYVAIDFYEGSIIYDFEKDITTICDIDLFRKSPAINNVGIDFWGTKRLKSPEEYIYEAVIDQSTNVYTLGALMFHIFGTYTTDDIQQIYSNNCFFPCPLEKWELNEQLYEIAVKAVNAEKEKRFNSISAFYNAWNNGLRTL